MVRLMHSTRLTGFSFQRGVSALSCMCSLRIVTDAYMTLPGSSPATQWHRIRPGIYFKTNTKMKCMILSLYSLFVGSKVANQF